MLDSFIIEQIQEERRRKRRAQVPLRIEAPRPRATPPRKHEDKKDDRGSVVIDFSF